MSGSEEPPLAPADAPLLLAVAATDYAFADALLSFKEQQFSVQRVARMLEASDYPELSGSLPVNTRRSRCAQQRRFPGGQSVSRSCQWPLGPAEQLLR
jgi:hypothetical protein